MNNKCEKENNHIFFKKVKFSDIIKLIEIEKSVSGKTYSAILEENEWKKELRTTKVYFIIDKDNNIVGELSYQNKNKDTIYISGLIIIPNFQNKGIGKKAMEKLMKKLKNTKKIELVTHPDNLRAINLYKSLGFIVKSRKENYFGDGEPRLKLIKINNTN